MGVSHHMSEAKTEHPISGHSIDVAERKLLFRMMLRIRIVEEKIAQVYPEHEIRCPNTPVHRPGGSACRHLCASR